jgi:hypothetical protein
MMIKVVFSALKPIVVNDRLYKKTQTHQLIDITVQEAAALHQFLRRY